MVLPKHHPQWGGALTYYIDLEEGTEFYVTNGSWSGEIVIECGVKKVRVEGDPKRTYEITPDLYAWIIKKSETI